MTERQLELAKLFSYDSTYFDARGLYGTKDIGNPSEGDVFGPEATAVRILMDNYVDILHSVQSYFPEEVAHYFILPNVIFSQKKETYTFRYKESPESEEKDVEKRVSGRFFPGINCIVLYMENIKDAIGEQSFEEVLLNTFVHELFHAYHFWWAHRHGIAWKDSSNESSKIVKEALAKAVEYQWATQNHYCDVIQHPIYQELYHDRFSNSPYKYALPLLGDRDKIKKIIAKYFSESYNKNRVWGFASRKLKNQFKGYLE